MGKQKQAPKTLFSLWNNWLSFILIGIISGLLVICMNVQLSALGQSVNIPGELSWIYNKKIKTFSPSTPHTSHTPKPHKLPPSLAKWQDNNNGDYFPLVKPTSVGYLIWSRFPVRIHIATPQLSNTAQAEIWVREVSQAVKEWNKYLPLEIVSQTDVADITIIRKAPPLKFDRVRKITRARSALTTYNLYTEKNILYHRLQILLSPSQTGKYLLAATRHELGHALGIWGHSQQQSDALYFSQVRNPPPISPRDINTLKRVYQQPTSLGWFLTSS